jgi:IMP dehydrogenase
MFTDHSDVLPADVDTTSRLSRRVTLKIPVITSAMDTITEAKMAIAMAEGGGIGSIHRNLQPEDQAKHVARVKHRLNGLIRTPFTLYKNMTVAGHRANQEQRRREQKNVFDKFPVVAREGSTRLVGVVTDNDLDFCIDPNRTIGDFMTPLRRVKRAGPGTTIDEAYRIMLENKIKLFPLVDGTNVCGMYLFSDAKRIRSGVRTMQNTDSDGQLVVCASVGVGDGAMRRAELLAPRRCNVFHIDTAHGDSGNVFDTIRRLKAAYPTIDVIAGNISRGESAKRLVDTGVDGILVGQGPGAICITRIIAGIGVPQVSAIFDCVRAVEDTDVPIIADGGIEYSGDAAVALAIGASCVMVGRYLGGTDETPGEVIHYKGRLVKKIRGMGSLGALRESASSQERYLQTANGPLVPEGVEGLVNYQGPVHDVLDQLVGGVRKSMGYLGAKNLTEFRERADLFLVPDSKESHPHSITISEDAPNYQARQ